MNPSSFIRFSTSRLKRVAFVGLTTLAVVVAGGLTVLTAIYVSDRRNTAGKIASIRRCLYHLSLTRKWWMELGSKPRACPA
jgi:hypothetical protein